MGYIESALGSTVGKISDENYAQSLAFYQLWLDIVQTYPEIPPDQISGPIWGNRTIGSMIRPGAGGKLIHSTAHLIVRLASDTESNHTLARHASGLQSHLCARSLREFFNKNTMIVQYKENNRGGAPINDFYADANFIAHWVNLGYVEEAAIRNHILQSLISHPKLYEHQADALVILFNLAGLTFGAYADPSVVDRCFELLKDHYGHSRTIQVRAPCAVKGGCQTKTNS